MHPLVNDLSGIKDSELENKINELTRKYFMTPNPGVKAQMSSILDSYREELSKRKAAEYDKMMNSRDKGLDKLINIS
jgi:dihydropteroate synthase